MRYLNGPTGQLVDAVLGRESSGGTIAWYLPDRLGTTRDLIDNSGNIIDHVDYSAFGTVLGETDPSNGDRIMGFAGMQRDTVTGLNLAVYRVQDPGTGRWTSQDPLGFGGGETNLYRDVRNQPGDLSDPTGEDTEMPEKDRSWPFGWLPPAPPRFFPSQTVDNPLSWRFDDEFCWMMFRTLKPPLGPPLRVPPDKVWTKEKF